MASKLKFRWRAYFDLLRVPNLFTAQADSLAGFLYVGGSLADWPVWLALMIVSSCLYGGGVVFNDVCDVEQDARERSSRPIPAGRITRGAAARFAMLLLITGVGVAFLVSARTGVVACALVGAIFLYDGLFKSTSFAPPVMGSCRALNLMLGLSVVELSAERRFVLPLAIVWLYVTFLTLFARTEARKSDRRRLMLATTGLCASVLGLGMLPFVNSGAYPNSWALVMGLLAVVLFFGIRAVRTPEPSTVQAAVKTFVILLIGVDTCVAWSARGALVSLCVAVLMVPCVLLSRRFRVT